MKNKDLCDVMEYVKEKTFIDKAMATFTQSFDTFSTSEIGKAVIKIGVSVDEDKLKEWLEFCNKMNNIDKTDLIGIAVSERFNQLNAKISELEDENYRLKCKIVRLENTEWL